MDNGYPLTNRLRHNLNVRKHILYANYAIDTGEYHLHKTGKDNRSVANGMMTIPSKIGLLVGGSVPLFVLSAIGYQPNMEQTPEFINKFMMMFALFPAAFCLLAAILMQFFYKITDEDAARYARENEERAAATAASGGAISSNW